MQVLLDRHCSMSSWCVTINLCPETPKFCYIEWHKVWQFSMSPLFSELTQISSSFQDIEVLKLIVDTRQTAIFHALNYTFVQKVLTPSHTLFIIWNFFYKFVWFLFFFFLSFKESPKGLFLYLKMHPKFVEEVPVFRQHGAVFIPIFHSGFTLFCL